MEEGDPHNIDRKGKGKMEYSNVVDKGASYKKKDPEGNQKFVHKRLFSSVQENETAPVALPEAIDQNKEYVIKTDDTNVSISLTVAEEVISPPPQVKEATSSSPNWRYRTALGGHGTAAEYDVLEKQESSKNKDSEVNQIVTHTGSSSFFQENQTAPVALPVSGTNVTNISISLPVAEEVVLPPPHVEQRPPSFSNRSSTAIRGRGYYHQPQPRARSIRHANFPFGHGTSAAHGVLPPLQVGEGSLSSPNQRSNRTLHQCRYCTVTHAVQSEECHRRRGSSSTQYVNFSLGCTTPATSRSTSPPSIGPLRFKLIDSQHRPSYGGGGCSRTGDIKPLTDVYNNALANECTRTSSSLLTSQARDQERNDGSIDLLSRVGASNSLENEDNDGDHDQDHNNEEDDGALDLLSRVGRELK
ncbi:hypothetical protein L2E82_47796 [Cichorium intybus]|uniref:Uncharacterized protein n=1 Tax=Cichorium intybus TaxID=13427 RepID=A0ACB8YWK4_CICIN|nr:hypothetical protein L2E82_47796 [Cichorium intybus]